MDNRKLVLLVEDNIVNQKLASLLLRQLGVNFAVVENGKKAVEAVQKQRYDAILMDCQMPEMDGFEATKLIRRWQGARGEYTPIIAVTALAMIGDRERCIAVGMDDYVSKPIDRRVLKIKLDHWLNKESASRNQEFARKLSAPGITDMGHEVPPIDLAELREYYTADLEDVLGAFINSTNDYIGQMNRAILDHAPEDLARSAHELKSSAASVGAKELAKLALFLERAAGLGDWTEARDTFDALIGSFKVVRKYLRETVPLEVSHLNAPDEAVSLPRRD